MTTEANFPLQLLCLKLALYGRFSLDHLWPLLGDHQGPEKNRSILELSGLGREIWSEIDAQEYVNSERTTWNGSNVSPIS